MANIKKPRRERKKATNYMITRKIAEAFSEYCGAKNIAQSGIVEKAIIKFLKKEGVKYE